MSKFKVGDRVRVFEYGWADGLGTVSEWDMEDGRGLRSESADGDVYVRLDNYVYYEENDSHSVPKECIKPLTKLEKALR